MAMTVRTTRGRLAAAAGALGMAALGVGGWLAAPALADDPAPAHTSVVECRSGTVVQGDIETSSAVVLNVPAGTSVRQEGCSQRAS